MGPIQTRLIKGLGILVIIALYSFAFYRWGAASCEVQHEKEAKEKAQDNRTNAVMIAEEERKQEPTKVKIITRYVTTEKAIEETADHEKSATLSPLLYRVMYDREPVQRQPVNGQ